MSGQEPERVDVIVVGAGFAGLAAARVLEQSGSRVLVLEARDRPGGRAHSVRTRTGWVDLGATWFWPNEPHVRDCIDQLGVPVFPQDTSGDAVFEPNLESRQRLQGNPLDGPAFRFEDGAASFAHRIADQLASGTIRYGEPVHSIEATGDGALVSARNGSYAAGQVIVALPPALAVEQIHFEPALPAEVHKAAESCAVWMGGMVKAVAIYDRPVWREQGLAGAAISYAGPFREFHDHSGPAGAPAAIFGFAPSEPLASLTGTQLGEVFRLQLRMLFGVAARDPEEVVLTDWRLERYTSPTHQLPQADTSGYGAPIFQRPVNDRIHFASTETATAYAGHIEGALRAGRAAAERAAINAPLG